MINGAVKELLCKSFPDGDVKVKSGNCSGGSSHFNVHVVSDKFIGMSTIKRHQMIYGVLDKYLKSGEIHAIKIDAITKEEEK